MKNVSSNLKKIKKNSSNLKKNNFSLILKIAKFFLILKVMMNFSYNFKKKLEIFF